ncbi:MULTISPECIES: transporter substrate-binding domain-containing protein [unclassified Mesorhizobium]|uniref:transporter substrate-binding domain-containing protein n=1 Tax=unclassified Mesorhizobium TaxID=325217 RepID=UPI0010934A32|nr:MULTISPECIES: transporter substrate-binding domain-containing protein [unclassified Mesorhizobium]TGT91292.1 transporter substrate-binding domain-containing protein [Mesorhizobium sp. M8A.F.Ca.ET.161.01.1.1]TGV43429.1 transporter substrate-binding domain-containing protein [Mesorhizobium sp. M8A.F.Ca.ET.142.01.1.1]
MGLLRWMGLTASVLISLTGAVRADDAGQWSKIRIATEGAYAPWNYMSPDGKLVGYEIDLAQELCRRMKTECEIVAQDWDGMLPALNAGKFDAIIASMSVTPERQKVASFSVPYAKAPNAFMMMKDSPLVAALGPRVDYSLKKDPDGAKRAIEAMAPALKGKVLAVQGSSTAATFATAELKDKVEIREYKTTEEHNLDLVAGRVDLVMGNITMLKAAMKQPDLANATLAGPTFIEGVLGSGTANVAMRKDDTALKAKFDAAIHEVNADGFNNKLTEKWFGVDITPKD